MPAEPIAKAKEVRGQQGQCRVRYDNERGKGDHRHIAGLEQRYEFVSLAKLLDDFEHDVETWREP